MTLHLVSDVLGTTPVLGGSVVDMPPEAANAPVKQQREFRLRVAKELGGRSVGSWTRTDAAGSTTMNSYLVHWEATCLCVMTC